MQCFELQKAAIMDQSVTIQKLVYMLVLTLFDRSHERKDLIKHLKY